MHHKPYSYTAVEGHRFTFGSTGKRSIVKLIEFTPTRNKDVYNLAFGDLTEKGEIDDTAHSNNGDIVKIFATVINVLQDFTLKNPSFKIAFSGSTIERTKLYNRIIRTYYQSFRDSFIISGLAEIEEGIIKEVDFDPDSTFFYLVFFVKRN